MLCNNSNAHVNILSRNKSEPKINVFKFFFFSPTINQILFGSQVKKRKKKKKAIKNFVM